jgi:hypothetical protein
MLPLPRTQIGAETAWGRRAMTGQAPPAIRLPADRRRQTADRLGIGRAATSRRHRSPGSAAPGGQASPPSRQCDFRLGNANSSHMIAEDAAIPEIGRQLYITTRPWP